MLLGRCDRLPHHINETKSTMTHDERWISMWQSYMNFMADHGRRPSKYKPEERNLVNWLKYNRKEVNQGTFPESRKKMFDELLQMAERLHRVNQWK